jgi:tRNA U34 2-thiouridine synthase MnmA/TrmU
MLASDRRCVRLPPSTSRRNLISERTQAEHPGKVELLRGVDEWKDQTYFLMQVPQSALAHTLFPIGHMQKPYV